MFGRVIASRPDRVLPRSLLDRGACVTPSERRRIIVELFATERFRRAWVLLDAPDDVNRIPAFEGVRRMMSSKGISMSALLDEISLIRTIGAEVLGNQARDAYANGAGSGRSPFEAAHPTARSSTHSASGPVSRQNFLEESAQFLLSGSFVATRGLRAVTGSEVPRTVIGSIEELGSRVTPFGEVLSFCMRNAMCVYGPMAALDPANIERLRSGAESGARMKVDTLPAHGSLRYPSASRVSVALA